MDYQQTREYTGSLTQLMKVTEYRMTGGRMDGLRCVEVENCKGLVVTVAVDRCMDIWSVRAGGKNVSFHSQAGQSHPAYQRNDGTRWLSTFPGGFLSTCGLDNIGSPCELNGTDYPLHGQIGNAACEQFGVTVDESGDVPKVILRGVMRQAQMFGANLKLERVIEIRYVSDEIVMTDTLKNEGYHEQPYMMLYHFNLGYPLLSEKAQLRLPSAQVRGRNQHATDYLDSWQTFTPPQDHFQEMCYYHQWPQGGEKSFGLFNPESKLGVDFTYQSDVLDHFVQWKMLEKGTYVLGLEPCTSTIDGRADAAHNKSLKSLASMQQVANRFLIRFTY